MWEGRQVHAFDFGHSHPACAARNVEPDEPHPRARDVEDPVGSSGVEDDRPGHLRLDGHGIAERKLAIADVVHARLQHDVPNAVGESLSEASWGADDRRAG